MDVVLDYFWKGGWVMWPLFGLSILALGIALQRGWRIIKATRGDGEYLDRAENIQSQTELERFQDDLADRGTPLPQVLQTYLQFRNQSIWKRKVSHRSSRVVQRLERSIRWLPVIANVATLLGLFGTVLGMVDVFQSIQLQEGTPDPELLAGGIWQALLTTVTGVGIAIPTNLVYHFLLNRVDDLTGRMKEGVEILYDTTTMIEEPAS